MDKDERAVLKKCRKKIVQVLDSSDVLDDMMEAGVCTKADKERIDKLVTEEKARYLLDKLDASGPNAFAAFIKALKDSEKENYQWLATTLEQELKTKRGGAGSVSEAAAGITAEVNQPNQPNQPAPVAQSVPTSQEQPVNSDGWFKWKGSKQKKAVDTPDFGSSVARSNDDCYQIQNKRVLVFILSLEEFQNQNMNRKGGELDAKSLDELFQDLGYKVITKKNPTKDEIDELAEEVEFNVQHNMKGEIDLLIVCVMSHGRLGYFSSSDNKEVNVFQFLQSLNDIPLLQGKPKLFIMQACRPEPTYLAKDGGGEDGGAVEIGYAEKDNSLASFLNQHSSVVADGTDDGPQPFKDTLVVYSTQPAFYSYRDLYSGTWFTQSLVRVFRRPNTLARKEIRRLFDLVAIEMEEIIKRYNRGGAGDLRQGCEYSVNHFKKELFLNPPPSFN